MGGVGKLVDGDADAARPLAREVLALEYAVKVRVRYRTGCPIATDTVRCEKAMSILVKGGDGAGLKAAHHNRNMSVEVDYLTAVGRLGVACRSDRLPGWPRRLYGGRG